METDDVIGILLIVLALLLLFYLIRKNGKDKRKFEH